MRLRSGRVLRIVAVSVFLGAIVVAVFLPGPTGCPLLRPGEIDCPDRAYVLTAPRLVVLIVGAIVSAGLWIAATFRDVE